MQWLKKRQTHTTKKEFILTDSELKTHLAMEIIFERFDSDGNGTLELKEMIDIFAENQIGINPKIIRKLFKYADKDGSG